MTNAARGGLFMCRVLLKKKLMAASLVVCTARKNFQRVLAGCKKHLRTAKQRCEYARQGRIAWVVPEEDYMRLGRPKHERGVLHRMCIRITDVVWKQDSALKDRHVAAKDRLQTLQRKNRILLALAELDLVQANAVLETARGHYEAVTEFEAARLAP